MLDIITNLTSAWSGIARATKTSMEVAKLVKLSSADRDYGRRVSNLRGQVNDAISYMNGVPLEISPRKFADTLGYVDLDRIGMIEAGNHVPEHSDLERLVTETGVDRDYLLDGLTPPWRSLQRRVGPEPLDALSHFDASVDMVYAVRFDAPDGGVALILSRANDWRRATVVTFEHLHFGSMVGAGGAKDQASFHALRCALRPNVLVPGSCAQAARSRHQRVFGNDMGPALLGRTVDSKSFTELRDGHIHPYAFLHLHGRNDDWFLDFADVLLTSPVARGYEKEHGAEFAAVQKNVNAILT